MARWKNILRSDTRFRESLYKAIADIESSGDVYYPPKEKILKALQIPLGEIKVVILGMDPYPTPGVATGLAFDVHPNTKIPGSLRNILKKINVSPTKDSYLEELVDKGVFFYNASLSVAHGKPGSHSKYWKDFTEHVIDHLNTKEKLIWLIWGGSALKFAENINPKHEKIICSHPSPLGVSKKLQDYPSFEEINCFGEANDILEKQGYKSIFNVNTP